MFYNNDPVELPHRSSRVPGLILTLGHFLEGHSVYVFLGSPVPPKSQEMPGGKLIQIIELVYVVHSIGLASKRLDPRG